MAEKDKNTYSVVEFTQEGTVKVILSSWVECIEDEVGRLLFLKLSCLYTFLSVLTYCITTIFTKLH